MISPLDDRSEIWRVLVEPKMWATPMIVLAVDREDASQMHLIEHDHVIQAFSTDRPDHAFYVRILPRTRRR